MISLITIDKARGILPQHVKARRLDMGLTQEGLANRAGVSLATLRKFEQKGVISLEAFLKISMVLGALGALLKALEPEQETYASIDEVLAVNESTPRKRGWKK